MKNWIGILLVIFVFTLLILGIIVRDPFFIIIGILIGICILLDVLGRVWEKFFPKSKLAKNLKKVPEWIFDNIKI